MKPLFTLTLLYCCAFVYAQQYILLDDLHSTDDVKKYTLSLSIFGSDQEIELYNIERGGQLLLITVLPDLDKTKNWENIKLTDFQGNNMISYGELIRNLKDEKYKSFYKYQLVRKTERGYEVAKYTLIELFEIVTLPPEFHVTGAHVVNLGQNHITRDELEAKYAALYPEKISPLRWDMEVTDMPPHLFSIYLSDIEEDDTYRFWTFGNIGGIERFAYIKGKGIVGGSYDYYFSLGGGRTFIPVKETKAQRIRKRFTQENDFKKIMWAKELFPEKQ